MLQNYRLAVAGRTLVAIAAWAFALRAEAQSILPPATPDSSTPGEKAAIDVPTKVEVQALTDDEAIAARLAKILQATGWFRESNVAVDEGVVFLRGRTDREQYKQWAGDLARNTRDVVAVVNQVTVEQPSPFDFQPALLGLRDLWSDTVYWVPYVLFALVIFGFTYAAAAVLTRGLRPFLMRRVRVSLLREVIARGAGIAVFLLGLYIVLKVSGLTRLALTVLGGTGLFGLVLGIAFRDIAENFLASILLSVQSPFRTGDLVEIAGITGFVQQLNVRTTVLMSLSGNHVQLPNAIVYKSPIHNFSDNPNRREDFTVGIGYDVPIPKAQEIALKMLEAHPAVLKTPEPWVLVDGLGPATVNLRVYFWLDGKQYSWLKVRSSVIRLLKRAFQDNGVTMPDDAREIVFPQGVPIQLARTPRAAAERQAEASPTTPPVSEETAVAAEDDLGTEAEQIREQADQSRTVEAGENLLPASPVRH